MKQSSSKHEIKFGHPEIGASTIVTPDASIQVEQASSNIDGDKVTVDTALKGFHKKNGAAENLMEA